MSCAIHFQVIQERMHDNLVDINFECTVSIFNGCDYYISGTNYYYIFKNLAAQKIKTLLIVMF